LDVTVDDVLQAFAAAEHDLPREAMQWSLDHWDEAGPRFVAALEAFPLVEKPPEDQANTLFFALHLMAQKRETRGWAGLCRLMRHPDACDIVLGDATTTTLHAMILGMFDGDIASLQAVIEEPEADEFVRHAALQSLT